MRTIVCSYEHHVNNNFKASKLSCCKTVNLLFITLTCCYGLKLQIKTNIKVFVLNWMLKKIAANDQKSKPVFIIDLFNLTEWNVLLIKN